MNAKNTHKQSKTPNMKAVDFFCGGGGMSYGMQKAGIKILAGIDNEIACKKTYLSNIKDAEFINSDIFELKENDLAQQLQLKKNDDELILIGCSPCQFWSIINTDKNKSAKSKNLLVEFARFVKYLRPGYVVVENVPGVLQRKEESGLAQFINWLENHNYAVHFEIHNTYDFGVPQTRKRFTLIANRVTEKELVPKPTKRRRTVADVLGVENNFPKLAAGNKDKSIKLHTVANITALTRKRLEKVAKNGGNRLGFANDPELQLPCFVGKDKSFKDTFGRLWWDKPASTITTKFYSVSNGRFVHPEEDRAISLREGATLQSFPKSYKFYGSSIDAIARQIGNAVPPQYARQIGLSIVDNSKHG